MTTKELTREEGYALLGIPYKEKGDEGYLDNFVLINGYILEHVYVPAIDYRSDDVEWIVEQQDLESGENRHRGITQGCVFTEWALV